MSNIADRTGNILVTSAGRRAELVSLLRELELGAVLASDMSPSAPTLYVADKGFLTGPVTGPDYVREILDLCAAESVRYIVPTIDSELMTLAHNILSFERAGITVFVSSEATVWRCFDKCDTWLQLDASGVPAVPTQVWDEWTNTDELRYPIVVKPATGSSAKGVRIVTAATDLGSRPDEKFVIQPQISGSEVTIDVVASDGRVMALGARRREKVRGGEVERGVTVDGRAFLPLAARVACSLELTGPFNFQVFESPDEPLVSDVNPRLGGGLPLTEHAGGRVLEAMFGLLPLVDQPAIAASGVWMMRYDVSYFAEERELLT